MVCSFSATELEPDVLAIFSKVANTSLKRTPVLSFVCLAAPKKLPRFFWLFLLLGVPFPLDFYVVSPFYLSADASYYRVVDPEAGEEDWEDKNTRESSDEHE